VKAFLTRPIERSRFERPPVISLGQLHRRRRSSWGSSSATNSRMAAFG
jgi:hypothetical protein